MSSRPSSAWAPLRTQIFRTVWIASVVSNIGTWMHEVGAAWLMTTLAPSAFMVGMIQTMESVPIFALALLAGALADVIDRRRILLATQVWMVIVAGALGVLTLLGGTTPVMLLIFTFALSIGSALAGPAWQASMPDLVGRDELPAAVALNGVAFNIARAIGPALGGLVVAAVGSGGVFLINALSFIGVVWAIAQWKRAPVRSVMPAERLAGAVRAGLRYVRHSRPMRSVLWRSGGFIFSGSVVWTVLPLLARSEYHLSSVGYGILLGCFGAGAIAAATIMQRVHKRLGTDALMMLGTLLFCLTIVVLALVRFMPAVYLAMFVCGGVWMILMSNFTIVAQYVVPAWVRARALAVYQMVFWIGFAGGSVLWSAVATKVGVPATMLWAAASAVVGLAATFQHRLGVQDSLDLTPSQHWDAPVVKREPEPDAGPVMITVEYRVAHEHEAEFLDALRDLSVIRRRDGAVQWGIFHDTADPARFVETWVVESWAEHMRQHERVTVTDRAAEERVQAFHLGENPPVVEHFVYAR